MYPSNILILFFLYSSNILIFKLIKCVSLCSLQTYFLNIISLKILKFIYHLTINLFIFVYIFLKENRAAFARSVIFDVKEPSPFSIQWRFEQKKIHRILLCEFARMIHDYIQNGYIFEEHQNRKILSILIQRGSIFEENQSRKILLISVYKRIIFEENRS